MSAEFKTVWAKPLTEFCQRVFEKLGMPPEDGFTTADVLVLADLRGIDSHGVARLRRYFTGLKNGMMVARPQMKVAHETPLTALLDGGAALGQVAGKRGMEMAIEKALKNGVGFVAVRNSNHYGIAAYYSLMALKHDLIGISLTNSDAYVVPTFGKEVMLGTNPISVTVPAMEERPFVLDMSTAVATLGKFEVYSRMGKKIPLGWATDEKGRSSDDPTRVIANIRSKAGGGILPMGGEGEESGGHKGYGLDLLVDILCGVLSGSGYLNLLYPKTPDGKPLPSKVAHFFGALRVDYFRPVQEFKKDMDDLIRRLRNSAKAEGQTRIFIHGEKEFELEEKYRKEGIPLYFKVYDDLKAIASELGVKFDL
ncbi:MAG TPA: Ldh family oxidoreductase [Thermodesulfobacteriota bacterium]|nr:Ldh family oxidoreductase [Thermodesulfobacteriota bacterium]